ncbi:hypothetical protein F4859DRAFT_520658 [Xylaria cf. heliscus]|nr:hypothetical protein F4859DRAFT_520658 [Xylaria cf. heliscus]
MTPDLNNGGVKLVASYVVINFLAVSVVAFRFYAIYLVGRKTRFHDHLCIISLIGLLVYTTCTIIGTVHGGIGLPAWEVSPEQLTIAYKFFFASDFFWAISIASFRLSILLLYIEIFSVSRYFQWGAWASVIVVCSFFVGNIVIALTICQPVALNWDPTINGHCGNGSTAQLAVAAFNVALDIIIIALPLPAVWHLQLRTHKKVAITITFGLEIGISVINIARVVKVITCSPSDFNTFCSVDNAILTAAEIGVGTTVACVPALGPLIRRPKKAVPGSSKKSLVKTHVRLQSLDAVHKSIHATKDAMGAETMNPGHYPIQLDYRASTHRREALTKDPTSAISASLRPHDHKLNGEELALGGRGGSRCWLSS